MTGINTVEVGMYSITNPVEIQLNHICKKFIYNFDKGLYSQLSIQSFSELCK